MASRLCKLLAAADRCETIFSPPRYLHPGVKISLRYFHPLHNIFTPHYKWWNKLLFSDIIKSHHVPLQSGIFFILSMAFYSSQTVLTQYLNLSTNTEMLSFNSKEDSMLKCKFYGLNMNIYDKTAWYLLPPAVKCREKRYSNIITPSARF